MNNLQLSEFLVTQIAVIAILQTTGISSRSVLILHVIDRKEQKGEERNKEIYSIFSGLSETPSHFRSSGEERGSERSGQGEG